MESRKKMKQELTWSAEKKCTMQEQKEMRIQKSMEMRLIKAKIPHNRKPVKNLRLRRRKNRLQNQ